MQEKIATNLLRITDNPQQIVVFPLAHLVKRGQRQ